MGWGKEVAHYALCLRLGSPVFDLLQAFCALRARQSAKPHSRFTLYGHALARPVGAAG